jgi:hypothetical protein
MNIKGLLFFTLFSFTSTLFAQSTFFSQNRNDNHFIDRIEILNQNSTHFNYSSIKPYNRKYVLEQANLLDSLHVISNSKIDRYNLEHLYLNNRECTTQKEDFFKSKKSILKTFYTTKANFFEVNNKDFFLAVNPVINVQLAKESDYSKQLYLNARGITVRGRIAGKIGFSSTIIENQERGPQFYQQEVSSLRAVPGVGFYKNFKNDASALDYFDGSGYFTFNATKYIDFQMGYDKNFIGNGFRSLFLSDWGNSYLFVKINTKIWKFNYQNLFMELMPQFQKSSDALISRKYAAMHHLSIDATKWLNVGLFEGVIFGRKDHFDFQYLNPIIFYRHIEGAVGSPDNAVAGFDFKANLYHRFQFYGQLLLDEFILSRIKNDPTNWANKFGIQLGGKYINAFGVKNLDLQVEANRVRPFTYSHSDSTANYTHYNQPLAHPLGANFQELIGIVRYQPINKLFIYARAIYYYQGLDSAGKNFGGNIFRDYSVRQSENGFALGSGKKADCLNLILNLSYELKQNLYIDAGFQNRTNKIGESNNKSNVINFGLRLNINKREYDF